MSLHQLPMPTPAFDVNRRYVRFRELRADGYVEFTFSIGDPQLGVELTMPLEQYKEFCRTHKVTYLTRDQCESIDLESSKWRFGAPGLKE
ncbi:MAG: phenol hydroxylase subunit [Sinimarinibacterium flocculans]|uniref:phenol hydroxylase subunit n=1 Tax=Sinimarinibacterium flocculans TaxID=985250 RepID=UPI003C4F1AE5